MKQYLLFIGFLLFGFNSQGQTGGNLDKIIGIVGDRIVLKSEIELTLLDYKQQNSNLPENAKCDILEQVLGQKILAEQATRDSVVVSEDEIEGNLENRIRYFVRQFGSEDKLEEVSGKTVYQLKDDYRPIFQEQMLAERMQQQIMSVVKITPQEVKNFYNKIPQDSLPYYPSSVEVGQIVFAPKIDLEVLDYAKKKLEGIRKDIVEGVYTFEVSAGIYSEDPRSRDNGGDLGLVTRDEMVSEFSAVGFRLQNGEISDIVKTEYGYHIIQMISRQGEKAHLRHILIKPQITTADINKTIDLADSVRAELMAKKITFSEGVAMFSSDKQSKLTGGMLVNPQTGSTFLDMDQLDASTAIAMENLKVGQYSEPQEYTSPTGDKSVRILFLKTRTEPHKANLQDDYAKIQQVALAEKQNTFLFNWLEEHIPTFYIMIDPEYATCPNAGKWMKKN